MPKDFIHWVGHRVHTLDDKITCTYKSVNDNHLEMGPYSPYESVPYTIIYGKGLAPNSSIFIYCERTYEGMVHYLERELTNPLLPKSGEISLKG